MKKTQESMTPHAEEMDSKKVPLHKRPMHPHGYMYEAGGAHGATYSVEGKEYVLIIGSDGKPMICNGDDYAHQEIKDQNTINKGLKISYSHMPEPEVRAFIFINDHLFIS